MYNFKFFPINSLALKNHERARLQKSNCEVSKDYCTVFVSFYLTEAVFLTVCFVSPASLTIRTVTSCGLRRKGAYDRAGCPRKRPKCPVKRWLGRPVVRKVVPRAARPESRLLRRKNPPPQPNWRASRRVTNTRTSHSNLKVSTVRRF